MEQMSLVHTYGEIDADALDRLADRVRGTLVTPGDAAYEELRGGWNARISPHPGGILLCSGAEDIGEAVRFARSRGIRLAVRSGGHEYAGKSSCDGGLVLDLSGLDSVDVDPRARIARVGPGARWAAVDAATQAHGLATTGGTVSTVGVAGYTLGGGNGHLGRRFGLALDNLESVEVVTAAGEVIRASERENPDLFWALRGGSGNFGIVTRFDFRLHPVSPDVLAGQIMYPLEAAPEVLRGYRDFMAGAPDELQCYAFFLRIPPLDVFPEALHGQIVIDLVVVWTGPVEEGPEAVAPLRQLGTPVLDAVLPQTYTELQRTFDAGMPAGLRWHSETNAFRDLPEGLIDAIVEHVGDLPGPFSVVYLAPLGGAIGRIAPDATAFAHRDAMYDLHIFPGWSDPELDREATAWAREFRAATDRFSTGGVYVNLLGPDAGAERTRAAYGSNLERLRQVKRTWDPDNLFHHNHNIAPAS